MGGMKRLMEQQEEQRRVATEIAVAAGALKVCDLHFEVYDPMGDKEGAYRLGNYKFTHGQIPIFHTRQEMTETIKEAIDDAAMECATCAKWREED